MSNGEMKRMLLPSHVQTTISYRGRTLRELSLLPSCTMVKTLKEILYQPDPTWLQFRRRFIEVELSLPAIWN